MRFSIVTLLAAAAIAWPAAAQEPPARVGRVAHIEGQASIYQDPEIGWERAYVNSPLTSENSLWTERGSRAEMRVGATAVRLSELTQLDVSALDDVNLDAFVARGTVAVRVRYKESDERLAFSTPHALFVLDADGRYRLDVDADKDESRLTVFAGAAHMESQAGAVRIEAGSSVVLWDSRSPSYEFDRASSDAFDRWTLARDGEWRDSTARNYVSPYMTGYEDLDVYGRWENEPDLGAIWYPTRVASDWAPYRQGHWAWVRPWGWTWIDDEPWGYAPFHYGRWVYVHNRWAWVPGQREARPAWAPALVAWVGGSNLGVGVSAAAPLVGWYPLAPWDHYEPWWHANTRYVERVNAIARAHPQPPREWRDRDRGDWHTWNRERGATIVHRDDMLRERRIPEAIVRVDPERIRNAQPAAPAQVLPQRNDFLRQRSQAAQPSRAPTINRPAVGGVPATAPPPAGSAAPSNTLARPDFARRAAPPAPAPTPAAAQAGAAQQQPTGRAQWLQEQQRAREAQQQQPRGQQPQPQQQQQRQPAQPQPAPQAVVPLQQPQPQPQPQAQQPAQPTGRAQWMQEQQRSREAQQLQQQQREAQQREAQQRAQQQQQQQREAQQREAQQRAQQQQQQQQREAQQREAQQRAQQQQQQQQQQREAQQHEAQQRAAREAQQQQERAAHEAQQQQQRAQQQQPPQQQPQHQQPQQAHEQNRAPRGGEQKEKEKEKEKEKDEKQQK